VAFASEAKAVLAAFPQERRPDRALVHDFVSGAVPGADEHTFFENVRSVLPGQSLCIDSGRETVRQHCWLAQDAGLEAVRELLLDQVTLERGWLDPAWLKRQLSGRQHKAARWSRRHLSLLWKLLTLEMWCRQFLDGDRALQPEAAWPRH
jgi:asparagine synthetase B (glutamine-hydrolysing)